MLNAIFSSVFTETTAAFTFGHVPCLHSSVSDSGTVDRCCLQVQKRMHQKLCCHACSDACDRTEGDHARQWNLGTGVP